jgi:hypothetical protein
MLETLERLLVILKLIQVAEKSVMDSPDNSGEAIAMRALQQVLAIYKEGGVLRTDVKVIENMCDDWKALEKV